MRKSIYVLLLAILISTVARASDGRYVYKLDLTKVVDDKVYIELTVPEIEDDEVTFSLPKMIPGTYAIEDYGRFVSEFTATDKKGRKLPFEKINKNSWRISKAKKLAKISYWVEDSYDTRIEGEEIFQPAGTNIEAGKNFIINASGYFGYFEGKTGLEYEINILKPANFYGSTGLIPESTNQPLTSSFGLEDLSQASTSKIDVFITHNYDELVDSPIMYCLPDTALIDVAGTQVLVASYSPNKMVSAKEIANTIDEVLMAQRDYLGGTLPVDKYAFIFYFTDEPIMSYGALEHSYSSFYYMPEYTIDEMEQQLRDFAAHEFFHIVTPLSIHSKEIQPFDFTTPKMSKHLWLYEGMTEYFAENAQVKGKLISIDHFINKIREKMMIAAEFNDTLPMTELSLGALDTYADQYYNVYQKGALIGMALDITLLDLSKGSYGVQQMMKDLAKEYGKDKAFDDNELFDKITELTYPEIREFFTLYIEGSHPLPYADILAKAGLIYEESGVFYDYSLGLSNANFGIDMENGTLFIKNDDQLDEFGKLLGYKNGDVILAINDRPFPELGPRIQDYIMETLLGMVEGNDFTVKVLRTNSDGENKEVLLSAKITKVSQITPYAIRPATQPTEEQLTVLRAWLGAN